MSGYDSRVILVGCGSSGKTSIVKVARILYGSARDKGLHKDAEYRVIVKRNIQYNLIMTAKNLIRECSTRKINLGQEVSVSAGRIIAISEDDLIDERWEEDTQYKDQISKDIRALWKESCVKDLIIKHYPSLSVYILDNAKYFLESTFRVFKYGYTATDADYLENYTITSGVPSVELRVDGRPIRLFDTGGQRSERRKWRLVSQNSETSPHVHCFVVDLSGFDVKIEDDNTTTRLNESFEAFKQYCIDLSSIKNEHFDPEIVLILNKRTNFRNKINQQGSTGHYFRNFVDQSETYEFNILEILSKGPSISSIEDDTYECCLKYVARTFVDAAAEYYTKGSLSHIYVMDTIEHYQDVINLFETCLGPLSSKVINRTTNPSVPSHMSDIFSVDTIATSDATPLEPIKITRKNKHIFSSTPCSPIDRSAQRRHPIKRPPAPVEQEAPQIKNLSIKDKYKLKKLIAKGGQGSIYLVEKVGTDAENGSARQYIMKRMELKNGNLLNQSFDEIKNLYQLNGHKNICNIIDFFMEIKKRKNVVQVTHGDAKKKKNSDDAAMDQEDHTYILAIVMEYCHGGDMRSYLATKRREKAVVNELVIVRWLKQIADALSFVHSVGLIHRDMKPENIFFQDVEHQVVMLGDFGLSVIIQDRLNNFFQSKNSEAAGSPFYTAPEQMAGVIYDSRVDVWALGCIVLEMMTLEIADYKLLTDKQREDKLNNCLSMYSYEIVEFVRQCVKIDPDQRPNEERFKILIENIANS
ncbi:hypothetical protein AKO1_008272 [Acrasis kona]|uniref:non-specific serine/threonine protein kinase n=1 Tax=Acrasis kona TaxID=1008807 RepID=A0AAW2YN14_9EUKA